jgi:hypothetical protein
MVEVLGTTELEELSGSAAQRLRPSLAVSGFSKPKGWRSGSPTPRRSGAAGTLCASCGSRTRDGRCESSTPSIPGGRPS